MKNIAKLIVSICLFLLLAACNSNNDELKIQKSNEIDNRGLITPYVDEEDPERVNEGNIDLDMDDDRNRNVKFGNQQSPNQQR